VITQLQNKNIYLAPKNNVTIAFNQKLKSLNMHSKGYIDNFKRDMDVVDKKTFTSSDVVIVFSPNYWEEIIKDLDTQSIYILNIIEDEFILFLLDEFQGYDLLPCFDFNKLDIQKYHWDNHLRDFYEQGKDFDNYGYEWGNPNVSNNLLGNYLSIKEKLISLINKDIKVLEIGTLGGKWTKYMLNAKEIICVDINKYFIEIIKKRFEDFNAKIEFYVSSGNELDGIKEDSIDLIFCMDTLVRVEKGYIFDYIREISRVLKKEGKAIIHLPNSDVKYSKNMNFTELNTEEIQSTLSKYFKNFNLDSNTISHGTLVYINC